MDLKNMKARKVCTCPQPGPPQQLLTSGAQVGVFTDPNVAKLTPMKNVWVAPSVSPLALNPTLRRLPLWNPKPTFHSKCTTKVCVAPTLECALSHRHVITAVVSEPTEASWRDAIAWARTHDFSHFLACASRHPCSQTIR